MELTHVLLNTEVTLIPDLDRSATFEIVKIEPIGTKSVDIYLLWKRGAWGNCCCNRKVRLPKNFTKNQLEASDIELREW